MNGPPEMTSEGWKPANAETQPVRSAMWAGMRFANNPSQSEYGVLNTTVTLLPPLLAEIVEMSR